MRVGALQRGSRDWRHRCFELVEVSRVDEGVVEGVGTANGFGFYVDDFAGAFDGAGANHDAGMAGGAAVAFVDLGTNDEVGDACFVFDGDEDDAAACV